MVPIKKRLYPGATTKVIGHTEVWFDGKAHTLDPTRMPSYKSNVPTDVKAQCQQLQAAGLDALMYNWYGPGNFKDDAVKCYFANSPIGHIINIDNGAFSSLATLQACLSYIRKTYFTHPKYEKWNGKFIVSYFVKSADPAWFRQVEQENTDVIFVYNGSHWGKSQMAWVQHDLEANADWFIRTFCSKNDGGLYIPCASAGFNDLNSKTGKGVWGADPARIWPAGIGANENTLNAYFQVINKYFSTTKQLDYLQLVTINDQDEGTGLLKPITQSGIDTFLPPVPKDYHLELWIDSAKLGDIHIPTGAKDAILQQVDQDGVMLWKASHTIQ